MRRFRRVLVNVLTALSLLLFAAAVALWVRSYWVRDIVGFGRAGGNCHLAQSILGRAHLSSNLDGGCTGGFTYSANRLSPNAVWHGGMSGYPAKVEWRLGFVFQHHTQYHFSWGRVGPAGGLNTTHRLIVIPYWFPAVLFAAAPAAWCWRRYRRGGRVVAGLCSRCGYDLRATPGRCPECGAVPTAIG
jgi:hypothetical protein